MCYLIDKGIKENFNGHLIKYELPYGKRSKREFYNYPQQQLYDD